MSANAELRHQISSHIFQTLSENAQFYDTVEQMILEGRTRHIIGINELDTLIPNLATLVISSPLTYFTACEEGFQRVFESVHSSKTFISKAPLTYPARLGVKNWLGSHTVTPRGLSARLVNTLVCVQGIITRCSLVRPKCTQSVHVTELMDNSTIIIRDHHDYADLHQDGDIECKPIPRTDKDGNPLTFEIGLSSFKDTQVITLQEMPEVAPTGQLPRSVEVSLQEDLVDTVKPGDRVSVWGVYKALVNNDGGRAITGLSRSILIANNVEKMNKSILEPDLSPLDIQMIREIAARPDAFELLSASVAPSICGHEVVKKGLLLQLFGDEQKILENGMKIRGDIHILLIGDPSCGKSQLLRFMLRTTPLALSTTGQGSSGVGLTAAVTTNKETKEKRLEAGAMVLGDGGLVCIDEFDKMSFEDRVAIHEVMEQQTVTISKAGIHTSLNARTTVLAAANPVYGALDPSIPLKSQIVFPDSLLSRFDLIYIIRDAQSREEDRRICSQVLRQLQTVSQNAPAKRSEMRGRKDDSWGVLQPQATDVIEDTAGKIKYWDTAIIPTASVSDDIQIRKILSVEFLQKYRFYAKKTIKSPFLSDEAIHSISTFYSNLRQSFSRTDRSDHNRVHALPTIRTLEACIRLATAHATLKLKSTVDREDAEIAEGLLSCTLIGEYHIALGSAVSAALPPPSATDKKKRSGSQVFAENRKKRHEKAAESAMDLGSDSDRLDDSNKDADYEADVDMIEKLMTSDIETIRNRITSSRLRSLRQKIANLCQTNKLDSIPPEELYAKINGNLEQENQFRWEEYVVGIRHLQSTNKLMLVNNEIWFI